MGTTTLLLALSAIVASTPREEATVDRVDLIELNHCFDEYGRPAIDQLIFYDWCTTQSRFQVRAWRLLKTPAQLPRADAAGGYMVRWQDGVVLRQIYAKQFRETWTQYDPELVEREHLPKDKRRDLRKLAKTRWNEPPSIAGEVRDNPVASVSAPSGASPPVPMAASAIPTVSAPAPANVEAARPAALTSTTAVTAP